MRKQNSLMTKQYLLLVIISVLITGSSCDKTPLIDDSMLDGDIIFDPSINDPHKFLISAKYPEPTKDDRNRHIIIAAHGYTATTFEWSEFHEWSKDSTYRVSQVLLDGHGTTYDAFRASCWEDWMMALKREYEALENLGYQKISFVGSSTGATLILQLVNSGYFEFHIKPKNIFLIDPIVVPSAKLQSIAGVVGPMIVYVDTKQSSESDKFWYHYRPHETIDELNELMIKVRKALEDGFKLPQNTYMKVFHSKHDPTANSLSTVLIYRGLKKHNNDNIEVQIMDSNIHVFTRLKLRKLVTALNMENQKTAFTQIANKLY